MFTAFGEEKTVGDWAKDLRCAVGLKTLDWRLRQHWDPETAITAPPNTARRDEKRLAAYGAAKTLAQWLADPRCVASVNTVKKRVADGWTLEAALSTPVQPGRRGRFTALTDTEAAELRSAAEKLRSLPLIRRHTRPDAPEVAAARARDALIRALLARNANPADIARETGLTRTQIYYIRDRAR